MGGTALALQLGHRRSIDVDLFSTKEFDSGKLAEHLKSEYGASIHRQNNNGVFGYIGNTKFDILTDVHLLFDPVERVEGIRMLSLRDIGAMKMSAIYDKRVNSGSGDRGVMAEGIGQDKLSAWSS